MKLARALNNNLRRYRWSPLLNIPAKVYCFFRFVSKDAGIGIFHLSGGSGEPEMQGHPLTKFKTVGEPLVGALFRSRINRRPSVRPSRHLLAFRTAGPENDPQ